MLSEGSLTKQEETRITYLKLEIKDLQKFISSQANYNKVQELNKNNKLNELYYLKKMEKF